ncbi:MAG: magnesium transporter CorA family protein [Prosthecobacter sp.]|jgi:magnesium transporter|uniref:magnesium transporter CorA family protein n=1 Tax=Prosthecobacter sp. TaxID=1965333 RepID=UPI001A04D9E4|nr:magnesium transporter CorA family protein [Prosthecobacter sp.]MBE2283438.1 magnesium transporter CorA family protein [Prosthecobacter sp.]
MVRLLTQQGQLIDWNDEKTHPFPDNLVYLDLLNPGRGEELEAEKWLEYQLPTREEMQEIEESSRLYMEKGALYMTAWIPVGLDTPDPENTSMSFVIAPDCLTTVRYADPMAFRVLADQVRRQCSTPLSSDAVFLTLLELIVARIADALQSVEGDMKKICRDIFNLDPHKAHAGVEKDLSDVVKLLGRRSALVANLRESLLSLSRMLQYFLNNAATWMRGDLAAQFRSVMRDIKSLDDYTNQQTQEMTFLLESTLGLINIQQNQIIKIFTVASVLFMPPTLIASIYGMNVGLPAAENRWAFVFVMLVIVLSAVLPIWFFKRKRLL